MSRGLLGGQSSAVIYQVRSGTEVPGGDPRLERVKDFLNQWSG